MLGRALVADSRLMLRRTLFLGAGTAVLAAAGPLLPAYPLTVLTQALIAAMLAMSLDILLGYTGLPSLGHAAYFGVGAYAVAILATERQLGFAGCLVAGVAAAIVAAALFGPLAIRATGTYFLMITLALGMVVWGLAFRWVSLTKGDNGISGVPRPELGLPWSMWGPLPFFYLTLLAALLAWAFLGLLVSSPFGLGLKGIRESESRMRALGYDVWLHKYLAFVLSGAVAGFGGVFWAYYNGFVSPIDVQLVTSVEALLMVALGGPGTLLGPAIGAALIVFLKSFASVYTKRWLLILGAVYIGAILFAPRGLVGAFARRRPQRFERRLRRRNPKGRLGGGHRGPLRQSDGVAGAALRLRGVSRSFGGLLAVDGVELTVGEGERRAIIGPNGAGKTTLFNLIAGELAATSGSIHLFDRDVTRLSPHRRAALGLQRTFQVTNLFPGLTVLENGLLAVQALTPAKFAMLRPLARFPRHRDAALAMLRDVGLEGRAAAVVENLSHGEQRQLEIGLALAARPRVLLLDEPTAGLSPAESQLMAALLRRLDPSITMLIIEHDMDIALEIALSVTVLHHGRVIAEGPREAVKADPLVREIYLGA